MKTKLFLGAALIILGISYISFAQGNTDVSVADMQISTSIEDRVPVGSDTTFSSNVDRLYCYTRLINSGNEDSITHVWYYNDKEMARVELSVRGASWRTWSSKLILPEWTGFWRVDVLSADGSVLTSKQFTVE